VSLVGSAMSSYGLEGMYEISMERAVVGAGATCYERPSIAVGRPYSGGYGRRYERVRQPGGH
jgi:hypothetical protein